MYTYGWNYVDCHWLVFAPDGSWIGVMFRFPVDAAVCCAMLNGSGE